MCRVQCFILTVPRGHKLKENRRQCPSCSSIDSDHCKKDSSVPCMGDETKCTYFGVSLDVLWNASKSCDQDASFLVLSKGKNLYFNSPLTRPL